MPNLANMVHAIFTGCRKKDENSLFARACFLQTPNIARMRQTLLLCAATSHNEPLC